MALPPGAARAAAAAGSKPTALGDEKRSAAPVPSAKPAAPVALPASELTTPLLVLKTRMPLLPVSAMKSSPATGLSATPCGAVSRAAVPRPSASPAAVPSALPPLPAPPPASPLTEPVAPAPPPAAGQSYPAGRE